MSKSKLLAAALLKDDLDGDDKIHATLFSVAFGELDDLRKNIAQIPVDIDASANRFQKITTLAVDDFVNVANEALSKFIQRTNEIKKLLDREEINSREKQESVVSEKKINRLQDPSFLIFVSVAFAIGILIGVALTVLIYK